jgi:hypothetical protein
MIKKLNCVKENMIMLTVHYQPTKFNSVKKNHSVVFVVTHLSLILLNQENYQDVLINVPLHKLNLLPLLLVKILMIGLKKLGLDACKKNNMISVILLNKTKLVEIDVKIIFVNYVVHLPHNYSKKIFLKNLLNNVSLFVKVNFGLTNLIN